jgi:hypothetical protein
MGWTTEKSGFDIRQGQVFFSLLHRVQTGSMTHPYSYHGYPGFFLKGVKQPERKADRSTPSTTGDTHNVVTS